MNLRTVSYGFSTAGMLLFLLIWLSVDQRYLSELISTRFWLAYILAFFTSLVIVGLSLRKFQKANVQSPLVFGFSAALVNFVAVSLVFSAIIFVFESASSGTPQLYAARIMFVQLLTVGTPISVLFGIVYGLFLKRFAGLRRGV
jgi:hypothetical protein